MKKVWVFLPLLGLMFLGAGIKTGAPSAHGPYTDPIRGTFANSQADTIYYPRPAGLAVLAFAAHFKDSVSVDSVKVAYQVGGELTSTTQVLLSSFTAYANTAAGVAGSSANPSGAVSNAVTFTPLTDVIRFIVSYHSSGNGVTNNKVDYFFEQQFYN